MKTKDEVLQEIFNNDPQGILNDKKLNRKQAQDILLNIELAIHQLKELGPDYEIWQNANISYKTLKQIAKKLDLIG